MYCRFCGRKIKDDSIYCVHCGKNIHDNENIDTKTIDIQKNTANKKDALPQKEDSSLWGLCFFIPVILVVVTLIIFGINNGSCNSELLSGKLKSSDYTCTTSQDLTSYSITITPKTDIDTCEIQLYLYNSNGQKIYSNTISKSNLKKDYSYTYTFDFGFVNSLTGDNVKYTITGKRWNSIYNKQI